MCRRFVLKYSVLTKTEGTAGPIHQETDLIVLILNHPPVPKGKNLQLSGLILEKTRTTRQKEIKGPLARGICRRPSGKRQKYLNRFRIGLALRYRDFPLPVSRWI